MFVVERSRSRNVKVCIFTDYGWDYLKKVCGVFSVNNMNTYMFWNWQMWKKKPLSGYILLYTFMCFLMMISSGYFSCFMVILRSTTGPYGRPIAEVAYGEIVFFTPPRLYGRWAREEWLGCRHDVAHVRHTRVNTSVGSLYIVFFWIFIL